MPPLRLLCLIAHPDDEIAGFGGILQQAAARGIETHVLCLTAGEAGSYRGTAKSREELAALRRREFAASCAHLSVANSEVLNYPDGRLDHADLHEIAGELVFRLRTLRPQWLFTFGPEGTVTAHSDHSVASVLATLAFQWAPRPNRYPEQLEEGLEPWRPLRLYYSTADYSLPVRPPVANSPVDIRQPLTETELQRKIEAFRLHTTQDPLFETFRTQMIPRAAVEMFHLAATAEAEPSLARRDLWQGIAPE
jgi:LmbE family N-acetylglucosaminyl deacetylase